jgi:hypothetical protein
MVDVQRINDLELPEDMEFQRREWRTQRVAWCVMIVIVGLAVAGVFGGGPLARATAGERDGTLWAEYERFARLNTTSDLRVHLTPSGDSTQLWIGRAYQDRMRLEMIVPEPVSSRVTPDRIIHTFDTQPGEPVTITLQMKTASPGTVQGRLGVVGGAELVLSNFVYP